jgi:ATP-dependent Zn protease
MSKRKPTKSSRKLRVSERATAYHEAGHAVAAFFLNLSIGRRGVTIVPNKQEHTLGAAHVLRQLRANPEYAMPPRTHVRIEKIAVMCLAGDAAERKFSPRRKFGGEQDIRNAVDLLDYLSGSQQITQARLKVADLEARQFVKLHWKQIVAVAKALLKHKTLTAQQVREVILRAA